MSKREWFMGKCETCPDNREASVKHFTTWGEHTVDDFMCHWCAGDGEWLSGRIHFASVPGSITSFLASSGGRPSNA